MRRKFKKFDLDQEYLNGIKRVGKLKLAIVGRDPYPNGALQIPFVKETWPELDKRSAGYNLFNSCLGGDFKNTFLTPSCAAFKLLEDGIVLLNASYFYLEKENIKPEKHFEFVNKSLDVNYPILLATDHILLCGDAYKMMNWVIEFGSNIITEVPHPALQSKNRSKDKSGWEQWWNSGKIKEWMK
jgi:hypothetical protein